MRGHWLCVPCSTGSLVVTKVNSVFHTRDLGAGKELRRTPKGNLHLVHTLHRVTSGSGVTAVIPPHPHFCPFVVCWVVQCLVCTEIGVMISTTPTAAPQSRKQRRRQLSLAAADGTRSPTPGTFPRVATAPANLAPSSTTAATTKAGVSTKTRRPSSPAFGDTSELDAQISTLTLIRAYGYGAVPGTPLRLGNKASGSRRRTSTAVHGARDLLKSSGTDGSSMTGYNSPAAAGKVGGGEQQAKTRGKAGPTKPHREPWMGPLDSGVSRTLGQNA